MTTTRSRTGGTGTRRRLTRTMVAGGSAVMLGGVGLTLGGTAPAEADHGETYPHGVLYTSNWRVCAGGNANTLGPMAVGWATAIWNNHPELDVVQTCDNANVGVWYDYFPDPWFGSTACLDGPNQFGNCNLAFVALNATQNDIAANPWTQWKRSACHEFGHVGGLGDRVGYSTCMMDGASPPIAATPDQHDNDAISATYPR